MKKFLPLLSIFLLAAFVFAACNRNPQADANSGNVLTYTDTVGLAEFQKWKTWNELKDPTVSYQQGKDITYARPVKKAATSYSAGNSSNSMTSLGAYPAKTSLKKGWSRKAKGAVIGGGSGAVIGALINRNNRLVGGALGGALGAGIGYVVGNELDRKHGR